jgi:hypothetical protein
LTQLKLPLFALLLSLSACTGGPESEAPEPPSGPAAVALPQAALDGSWMLQIAAPGAQVQVMSKGPWKDIFDRQYAKAIPVASGDLQARLHAEASVIYRQAALLQAQSIAQSFSPEQLRDSDPDQVAYYYALSQLILGHTVTVSALGDGPDSLKAASKAWSELEGELSFASMPPIYTLPAVVSGQVPELPQDAVVELREQIGESKMALADPTATLQLAAWHEAAARAASDNGNVIADALIAPWRLPFEPKSAVEPADLPLEVLFLGTVGSAVDMAFLASVGADGADVSAVVLSFSERSMVAAAIGPCLSAGALDPQCVIDAAAGVPAPLLQAMSAGGSASVDHRMYAKGARATVLRGGSRVAMALGDTRGAALLRINALDHSGDAAADPAFLVSQAAWDAGTRNALRAQELLHTQAEVLPGMASVRVSLDVLHLRVSRDAGPAMPMH